MFFALMVGAIGIASHGASRRCFLRWWWVLLDLRQHLPGGLPSMFLALMVGAPGSLAPPPRGPTIDVFHIDVGRSRIHITTS
jgi:hypothetical protein